MTTHRRAHLVGSNPTARHRRGLTLIELLASLALLTAIAAACLGVVQTTSRAAAEATHAATWSRAAEAMLDSVAADLASADLDPIGDRARGDPRVRVNTDGRSVSLLVRTRDPVLGPCLRRYATAGELIQVSSNVLTGARSLPQPMVPPSERSTTALAARFDASIDDRRGLLRVTVLGAGTRRVGRVFRLDPEHTP